MKRLSQNSVSAQINSNPYTKGWVYLNAANGYYQLLEYTSQYMSVTYQLTSGSLRECWDYFQSMHKDKYDFAPQHDYDRPEGARAWSLIDLIETLNKNVTEFKKSGLVSFFKADVEHIAAFHQYVEYHKIPVELKTSLPDTKVAYCRTIPLPIQSTADWRFSKAVKPLKTDDLKEYGALPVFIFGHDHTQKEKAIITRLYNKYVEPIYEGIALMYSLKADITDRGKKPTLAQSMQQTLRWVVEYQEKGEMTHQQAAGFFFAHLDSVQPMREFFSKFYTTD